MSKFTVSDKSNLLRFITGIFLFFIFYKLIDYLNPFFAGFIGTSIERLLPYIVMVVFVLITLILFRLSKYVGLGFFWVAPTMALAIAMIFFEWWIHPPEE